MFQKVTAAGGSVEKYLGEWWVIEWCFSFSSLSVYWKAACGPWLIPFSRGSPRCQAARGIDLWVKRAFLGGWLFIELVDRRLDDSLTGSVTCTKTNRNVLLTLQGNFCEKSKRKYQANLNHQKAAKIFFSLLLIPLLFSNSQKSFLLVQYNPV